MSLYENADVTVFESYLLSFQSTVSPSQLLPTAGQYPRSVRQVKAFFMDLFPHTSPLVHEYCKYCLTALPPDDGTCATLNCPSTGRGQFISILTRMCTVR